MIIQLGLFLLIVIAIVFSAALMRRIEGDVMDYQRDLRLVEEERQRLDVACETLRGLNAQSQEELGRAKAELARLADETIQAEADLAQANEQPKQRLFMIDRSSLGQTRLWEVTIAQEGGTAPPSGAVAMDWAAGRTYLISGATDRDARHRAASRFSAASGYRLIKVERFRRA
ncbi:hypothetical protein [Niveispirillum irakense]|uniref:hypothetical protein n=1 Tax=Niveispirillum irakense TaxID=34011 RepID=UPI00040116A9|nr:hypothetical protein [Niveispirillum irakense]